jgi:hypothetical protein
MNGRQIVVALDRLLAKEAVTPGEQECDHQESGQRTDKEANDAPPFGDVLSAMSSSANPLPLGGERRAPEMSSAHHAFDR